MQSTTNWALMACKHLISMTTKKIALVEVIIRIILNSSDEYAKLNSGKKASKEGRNLLFSELAISLKFNPITSSLKYCFVKEVVISQTRVNKNS